MKLAVYVCCSLQVLLPMLVTPHPHPRIHLQALFLCGSPWGRCIDLSLLWFLNYAFGKDTKCSLDTDI